MRILFQCVYKINVVKQVFKPHLNGMYGSLLVMNKLLIEKRFNQVIELFEPQIPKFGMVESYSSNVPIFFRQTLPYDQLDCYVEAMNNLVAMLFYIIQILLYNQKCFFVSFFFKEYQRRAQQIEKTCGAFE
jgi:hypothetical protein